MGAAPKYPTPLQQLSELMLEYRKAGLSFDEAWACTRRPDKPLARVGSAKAPAGCIIWPRDRLESRMWVKAIDSSEEGWRRAYERRPPSQSEKSLALLEPLLANIATMQIGEELDAAASVGDSAQVAVA